MSAAFLRKLRYRLKDDSGVAGLVIAALIAVVAFTALSVFLNTYIGDRTFARTKGTNSSQKVLLGAVIATYSNSTSTHTLLCPDTAATPTGAAAVSCSGTTKGVLPWKDLGLSQDAAIDPYGNYYTYVISGVGKNVCGSVTSDISGATVSTTYTGQLVDATDLSLTDSNGETRNVNFAIISHGPNGLGAKRANGGSGGTATSSRESANAASTPTTLYSGPYSTDSSSYFDDVVVAPTKAELQNACKGLTPSGGPTNSEIAYNFDDASSAIDTTKFTTNNVSKTTDVNNTGNRVAGFTNQVAYLATASGYNFTPTVRPVYVSTVWTPNVGNSTTHGGISIATRATIGELDTTTPSDGFTGSSGRGITFRFYTAGSSNISAGGVSNTISIRNDGSALTATGSDATYNLINGKNYQIEAYDNGTDLWMRITQQDDVTNTATVRATSTADLTGEQRVVFINDFNSTGGSSTSYLDNIVIGLPMLALETGASSYATTAAAANGTTTGDLTLEAWIRPKVIPTSGRATIISQWDTTSTSTSSYRLYLDGSNNGEMVFSIGATGLTNGAQDFALGFQPTVDEWSHVAVTFDSTSSPKAVRFYVNGVLQRTATTSATSGIRAAAQRFGVGAEQSGTGVWTDTFNGAISEVRVWEAVRTSDEIDDNFQQRLPFNVTSSGLIVNWRLDPRGTAADTPTARGLATTTAAASPSSVGTTSATLVSTEAWIPTLSLFFRPLSTDTGFCPSGTIAGPYQCDFRVSSSSGSSSSITVPSRLAEIFAKVWGGGGGGYNPGSNDTPGGSGGFAGGLIQQVGPSGTLVTVAGQLLNLYVGGYGSGTNSANLGGGGGAGSGIYTTGGDAVVVAGGGGGASYSAFDVILAGSGNCGSAGVIASTSRCGIGGFGGGYSTDHSVDTVQANDQSSRCGGRGGDNDPTGTTTLITSPPSTNGDCDSGGASPTDPDVAAPTTLRAGGSASSGSGGAGGSPTFLSGGQGYAGGSTRPGGGGGGGGNQGGEAGGYRDTGTGGGYGGGGGSGTVGAGVTNGTGSLGSVTYNAAASYSTSATGNWQSGQAAGSLVTNLSPTVSAGGWVTGCTVTVSGGLHIGSGGNTITVTQTNISNNTLTLQTATNGGSGSESGTITFNCSSVITAGFSTTGANASDPYYSPSYLGTSLQNPGVGGTTGSSGASPSRDGRGGAVVLIW